MCITCGVENWVATQFSVILNILSSRKGKEQGLYNLRDFCIWLSETPHTIYCEDKYTNLTWLLWNLNEMMHVNVPKTWQAFSKG